MFSPKQKLVIFTNDCSTSCLSWHGNKHGTYLLFVFPCIAMPHWLVYLVGIGGNLTVASGNIGKICRLLLSLIRRGSDGRLVSWLFSCLSMHKGTALKVLSYFLGFLRFLRILGNVYVLSFNFNHRFYDSLHSVVYESI